MEKSPAKVLIRIFAGLFVLSESDDGFQLK